MMSLLTLDDVQTKAQIACDSFMEDTAELLSSFQDKINITLQRKAEPKKKPGRKSVRVVASEPKELSETEKLEIFNGMEHNLELLFTKHNSDMEELKVQFLAAARKHLVVTAPVESSPFKPNGSAKSKKASGSASSTGSEANDIIPGLSFDEEESEVVEPIKIAKKRTRKSTVAAESEDVEMTEDPFGSPAKRSRKSFGFALSPADTKSSVTPVKRRTLGPSFIKSPPPMVKPEVVDVDEDEDESMEEDEFITWELMSPLKDVVPEKPAVYALKVRAAKKPAFIGHCDNLRKRIIGHLDPKTKIQKNIDTFVSRNANTLEVSYFTVDSLDEAKEHQKLKVESFNKMYKAPPVYNVFF